MEMTQTRVVRLPDEEGIVRREIFVALVVRVADFVANRTRV